MNVDLIKYQVSDWMTKLVAEHWIEICVNK